MRKRTVHGGMGRVVIVWMVVCVHVSVSNGVALSASKLVPPEQVAAVLKAKNVLVGYDDGTIRWERTVTRAEAAKIVLAAMGEVVPALSRSRMPFRDVSPSHWAFAHVAVAAEMGLVKGLPGNVFDPDRGVTLAEFMVMLSRGYRMLGGLPEEARSGISIEPPWAAQEILQCPELVELVRNELPSVDLDYPASRGEVAVLTGKLMEQIGLAYDVVGVVEGLNRGGTGLILRVEDSGELLELSLPVGELCFRDGLVVNAQSIIGCAAGVVLDGDGKVAVVVAL